MKKKSSYTYWQTGFTLVELLVSISIIAILTVLASVSFSKAQKNGRDQRRVEDLVAIKNAAEQYYLLNSGSYPVSGNYTAGASWKVGTQVVLQKYPVDPKNDGSYFYRANSTGTGGYCVCARMEVSTNGNAEDMTTCTFTNNFGYFCVKNQQ